MHGMGFTVAGRAKKPNRRGMATLRLVPAGGCYHPWHGCQRMWNSGNMAGLLDPCRAMEET